MTKDFYNVGPKKSDIEVRISYRIIQLFSEGLYSSPHKAIEELVSNSFDAGATNVHVILPADLVDPDGTIIVVDDGIGMDEKGLTEHWLIGVSNKRDLTKLPKGRKQIGKFGIGKLATYVLANRLTHICKVGGGYYSTSMDYSKIPSGDGGGIHEERVLLPLRTLTEKQAQDAVGSLVAGTKPGYKAVKLFGLGAAKTWTVAIMSDLKDMASEIQRGRLRWILQTAMPLRDDFALFLNGDKVPPSKLTAKKIGHWVLGKGLTKIPKPAPENLEVTEDSRAPKEHRYGLTHPDLGRITGYAEVYEDPPDTGKSTEIERSNGFFVYVRGRLVNIDDPGFGINRNLLRHGTFSRFRMVGHIDKLDDELRSSRESLRVGPLVSIAQNILHGVFNHARVALEKHEAEQSAADRISSRIAGSPGSLTRRPIIGLVQSAFSGQAHPKYVSYPEGLDQSEKESFVAQLEERAQSEDGLVRDVQLLEMSQDQGVAVLDVETGVLQINTLHPFVAYFLEEYEDKKRSLPLELLAMSEVLLEAHLYESGLDENKVDDLMTRRDEALRYLARSTGKRNARVIAQDLVDASSDKDALEKALVAAFDSMGFDAVPLGGPGKPDGLAAARLAGDSRGKPHRYSVSLEAKSKEKEGTKVAAKTVGVSTIARQRDDHHCDYALVAGPDFPTSDGEQSALVKEIESDRKASGKTITLIRISDLAKLVRLVPLKRVGLTRIRDLFDSSTTPEQSKSWVEKLASEAVAKVPYKLILETIWDLQNERPNEAVEYAGLAVALQRGSKALNIPKAELIDICKSMSRPYPSGADEETRAFVRYWFDKVNRCQLTALSRAIRRVRDRNYRTLMWCAFSRLIITKKIGASLAMDVSHSRPHKSYRLAPLRPFEKFLDSVEAVLRGSHFSEDDQDHPRAVVSKGDARHLPIRSRAIDFVITSPPYLNAIDYLRGHKFSLVWMGHQIGEIRKLRSENVGAESSAKMAGDEQFVERALQEMGKIKQLAPRFRSMLARYAVDMDKVLAEISRVLKKNGEAVLVVGDSTIRETFIRNSRCLAFLADRNGLSLRSTRKRSLPDNRRYLPPPGRRMSGKQLRARMRQEVVLVFSKSSAPTG